MAIRAKVILFLAIHVLNAADCHNPRHTFERGTWQENEFQLPTFYIEVSLVWSVISFCRATFRVSTTITLAKNQSPWILGPWLLLYWAVYPPLSVLPPPPSSLVGRGAMDGYGLQHIKFLNSGEPLPDLLQYQASPYICITNVLGNKKYVLHDCSLKTVT
jgi:hypothetical protein